MKPKPSIGIIGSGRLGSALAKQLLGAGYSVRIANSRGVETLSLIIKVLLPGAQAASVEDTITGSDIVILAIPLNQYTQLRPDLFSGKVVIDAMNYWPPTEGDIPEFMDENSTSSEYIQQYLRGAAVVKSLNHIAYNELSQHSKSEPSTNRRAVALAGDDTVAKQQVSHVIDAIGFTPVDLGILAKGKLFQPDTPLFNARLTARELKAAVKPATTSQM